MENISDAVLFLLPFFIFIIVIMLVVFYLLRVGKLHLESKVKSKNSHAVLNIRLQAYERLLLFLERISPQQLVVRNNNPEMNVSEFQVVLIANIREEYEHNLVQQLYISQETWAHIEQARSWVLKLVNDAASALEENAGASDLAMLIVEKEMKSDKNHLKIAIKKLKQEVGELF